MKNKILSVLGLWALRITVAAMMISPGVLIAARGAGGYRAIRSKPVPLAIGVKRDANGRIARSASARESFLKQTGYPNGRPGYIVDHIVALKRGGCDCPENMQWQTIEDAKAKDKIE